MPLIVPLATPPATPSATLVASLVIELSPCRLDRVTTMSSVFWKARLGRWTAPPACS